jgi:hypothetical protein
MPLQKLVFRPGVNKENTNYANEEGWYSCDKIRFRSGFPEKIGGWTRNSNNQFLGVCRSLTNWTTLNGTSLIGVGTNSKMYLNKGGAFYDITPIYDTTVNASTATSGPFFASNGSNTVTVVDATYNPEAGDYVIFSGAANLYSSGGNVSSTVINTEYQVASVVNATSYTVTIPVNANANDTLHGGNVTTITYLLPSGNDVYTIGRGWGAGPWSRGTWSSGYTTGIGSQLRLWTQDNFGEDYIFAPRGGEIYYWDASAPNAINTRAVTLESAANAAAYSGEYVPNQTNQIISSAVQRFVIAFGANPYTPNVASTTFDPLLVRWSDQENPFDWVPSATNQSGEQRLSIGSEIIQAVNTRQEILVFTDAAIYSMQYLGPPYVFGFQLLQDNTSIISPRAAITVNNITYWMGRDKFFMYSGRVETLPSSLRTFVFQNLNFDQSWQIFAASNEQYSEIWWFYPSTGSTVVDSYVVYNYLDRVWYYGTMGRTAWLDSGTQPFAIGADYNGYLLDHEDGVDDVSGPGPVAIDAYIQSSDFDIGDGHNFGFVWRILPDVTFAGSSATNPSCTMVVKPRTNSGSTYGTPNDTTVTRTQQYPVELFTGQVYTRIRGRQMAFRIESAGLGTTWQLGAPRIDIRQDGRR